MTPVRATLVHAGMRDDMADRWTPLIEAALARDGDGFAAPSPALTREALLAAFDVAWIDDYETCRAAFEGQLSALGTPPPPPSSTREETTP